MSFIEAIKTCFAKYATFKGRARRSEFWWFYLAVAAVNMVLGWILQIFAAKKAEAAQAALDNFDINNLDSLNQAASQDSGYATINLILLIIMVIWSLGTLLPLLGAWARRLHDVGKSGWLLLCGLICGVGIIIPLVLAIPDGKPEANQYGESPKYKDLDKA